ncbi:lipase maturation factor 1-like isoform X1 [Dendronephthya gigantea]|uniref:lipase maturation factor 1-like isoform X1 n=1 Tax=Dendronephthya gigantea TaxID=151771 RepID=UPI00106BEDDE|nr:lipase maturation factor 1-like isoform X1 [Dendronephthya gigantea]
MASNRNDNSSIRCRKNIENTHSTPGEVESVPKRTFNTSETRSDHRENRVSSGTYWLTRIVFLRSLAFVYFFAFLVALNQNKQLLGDDGLLPVPNFLNKVRNYFGGTFGLSTFQAVPSLLWAVNPANINQYLDMIAYCGALLSLFVFYTGCCNMVIMLILWILYHSLVNVGQLWYSFGWESQLLETGFLAIFLCPILKLRQIPEQTPTSWVVIFGYRWLIFRIMFGAGMIKIRGDQCWRDLTCMNYHYQTQPVPNPLSYYFHQSPEVFHKFETLSNHFIELVVPWFLLLPGRLTVVCGFLQIIFQVVLIFSGNLSFLNWLTILPSIMCFDDKALAWCFPVSSHARRQVCKLQKLHLDGNSRRPSKGLRIRWIMDVFLGLLLAYLSIPVVQNLFSSRQIMNTSFDSLRIVNTYGAFGSITKERTEIIIQGTRNKTSYGDNVIWEEYEFKCKPGNVRKRPCVISPYHYRLDWLMWFAAFQNYQNNPWLIHLSAKLLVNDPDATSLISHNPFKNGPPPRYIRAEHYLYEFTKFGSPEARDGKWWSRRKIATYFHPFSMKDVKDYLRNQGWKIPRI